MQISDNGLKQIKKHEGISIKAYYDQVGKPTIGYGNTFYENGRPVRMGDVITMERAEKLLRFTVDTIFSVAVNSLISKPVNQNQFDALVSFAYNVGVGALAGSTLLKKINADPDDPTIAGSFAQWNKGRVNGKLVPLKGLTNRRIEEAELYFKPISTNE